MNLKDAFLITIVPLLLFFVLLYFVFSSSSTKEVKKPWIETKESKIYQFSDHDVTCFYIVGPRQQELQCF